MSKELIKKFLISFNEGKAQEAKKYLSAVIKEKLDLATKEAESIVEAKKTKKKVKKQPTHMGKLSMMKPKLLKYSKRIKENIDGERTKFTVKAQEGKAPTEQFTDILRDNNIDVRFNEDTKNYCVPSEQFEETKNLLSKEGYEVTPVISMEDTNNDEMEDSNVDEEYIGNDEMEDIDMVDKDDTYQADRADKLRQSISDIRNKMNI